ncbi:glycogenin 1, isoform CRA_c [Thamnocephalis sphaerospora]|uniref:glycogenin glucosyltransferase n=1 Tax=Thamnocephalis sphaerospora TaxID=78915 RepID=A0A4P9XQU1_9FUNG|nr:glycogenin 1, isoform CRA_c [Thamnocephalis sphaerospora]|eukprot:RKP08416.1 glycogenin 1, isoform CRA_c [Thamnocephalis sphaerospora]
MASSAYCTLVTSNEYSAGALVLGHTLRQHGTSRLLACMVTPGLDAEVVRRLHNVFHHLHFVDPLDSLDVAALALLGRPELGVTLTKLQLWRLTQYDKVVFLDADTFPLRNVDELFEREEFSAAADIGWPDCFNSGVFVCRPSLRTYHALMQTMSNHGSFDGGDQGVLNTHFSSWSTGDSSRRLPFIYNVTPSAWYR